MTLARSSSFLSSPHILSPKSIKSSDLLAQSQTTTSSFPSISHIPSNPRKQRKTYHFQHIRKESPAASLHYLRHSHSRTSSFLSSPLILSNPLKIPKTLAFSAHLKRKMPAAGKHLYDKNPLPFLYLPLSSPTS